MRGAYQRPPHELISLVWKVCIEIDRVRYPRNKYCYRCVCTFSFCRLFSRHAVRYGLGHRGSYGYDQPP
jgi:hypothetical protein